eukprot:6052653-Prymnesium_polylepis.1
MRQPPAQPPLATPAPPSSPTSQPALSSPPSASSPASRRRMSARAQTPGSRGCCCRPSAQTAVSGGHALAAVTGLGGGLASTTQTASHGLA